MKNKYTAPELTIVQFRTEMGFAASRTQCQSCPFGMDVDILTEFAYDQVIVGQNATGNVSGQAGYSLGGYTGDNITSNFERW